MKIPLRSFLSVFCLLILSGFSLRLHADDRPVPSREVRKRELIEAALPFERLGDVFHQAVEYAGSSIVHIEAKQLKTVKPTRAAGRDVAMQIEETGCGVVVEIDGRPFILTNRHVVEGIELEGIEIRTKNRLLLKPVRIRTNADFDLAVIEFEPPDDILADEMPQPADLGDTERVRVGDVILVVGSPFGLERSVSMGVVGAVGRRKVPSAPALATLAGFFQIDAAVNPGSSGGPMLNLRGEVIGLVTAIATQSGANEGVAFATPIDGMMRIARRLAQSEFAVRPYIGVGFDPSFGPEEHRRFGLRRMVGARISKIQPDSPAEMAGLKIDDIILRFNDIEIEDDLHLINLVTKVEIGNPLKINVLRNGNRIDKTVTPSSQISR